MVKNGIKKTLSRLVVFLLAAIMLLGIVPGSMVSQAYAVSDSASHSSNWNGRGGWTFNTSGYPAVSLTLKYGGTSGTLTAITNHSLGGEPAFCINPLIAAGSSYSKVGTADMASYTTTGNAYWDNLSVTDKRKIAAICEYYANHPTSSTNTISENRYWLAKMGAQVAIFNCVVTNPNAIKNTILGRDNTWQDIFTYADEAMAYANTKASPPSYSGSYPSCSNQVVTLNFDGTNYVGTVTDSNNCRWDVENQGGVSGITVTRSGSTYTITATPEAAASAGLFNDGNSWKATLGAQMIVTDNFNMGGVKIFSAGASVQTMVIYDAQYSESAWIASVNTTLKAKANEAKGNLVLQKSSADTSITNGNSCYSLAGAVYGVYKENACTTKVGELTTDAAGNSNTLELPAATYYVKEISAPPGYELDTTVYTAEITANGTKTLSVSDKPTNDPVPIILRKKDDKSNLPGYTSGKMSLEGAQYTFKYYPGQYATAAAAEASGAARRTWIVQTNANGFADIKNPNHIVAGSDALYYAEDGNVTFPLGTVVIYETLAPVGYLIDNTKYVVNITESGASSNIINAENEAITPEVPIMGGITVTKNDSKTGSAPQGAATLAGAVFAIYNDNGQDVVWNGVTYADGAECMTITTNASGVASSGKVIPYGSYILREKTAPAGYALNTDFEYSFTISSDGQVVDAGICEDEVLLGGLSVRKTDAALGTNTPYGDASFEGTVFAISNASVNPVVVGGSTYNSGDEIMTITTDGTGLATTASAVLPYGDYTVTEKSTPNGSGYAVNSSYSATVNVRSANTIAPAANCPNTGNILGGVKVQKADNVLGRYAQGNGSLEGAVFKIINKSSHPVVVNGTTYAVDAEITTITTNGSGVATSGKILPKGTYQLVEETAPAGYALNSTWSVTFSITEDDQEYDAGRCKDEIFRGDLSVQKKDAGLNTTTPYGDATFEGTVFEIINASEHPVQIGTTVYASPGDIVTTITADASGVASTTGSLLPYGTYTVKEKSTASGSGYGVNSGYSAEVTISAAGTVVVAEPCANTGNMFGEIEVHKVDAASSDAVPQGDASLSGAVYSIVNASAQPVIVSGTTYAVGDTVMTITTDADGIAKTGAVLPKGTYTVAETTASTGYAVNSTWTQTVEVREDSKTYVLDNRKSCPETVFAGGVAVQKYAKSVYDETGDYTQAALGVNGFPLENAEITIINRSANAIVFGNKTIQPYDGAFDRTRRNAAGIVTRIYTNAAGLAQTGDHDLPYGTYELYETASPTGYAVDTNWVKTVQVREDGHMYILKEADGIMEEMRKFELTVGKTVIGSQASRDKYFKFDITINNVGANALLTVNWDNASGALDPYISPSTTYDSATITAANTVDADSMMSGYQWAADQDGTVTKTVYLKHGQKIVIGDLPTGATYSVVETPEDYRSSAANNTIANAEGIMSDSHAMFINIREGLVPTGVTISVVPGFILIAVGIVTFILARKRKRANDLV